MCSGNGAPGISTTFSGKRGMSDKRALLPLFDRILSHLACALLSARRRLLLVWTPIERRLIFLDVRNRLYYLQAWCEGKQCFLLPPTPRGRVGSGNPRTRHLAGCSGTERSQVRRVPLLPSRLCSSRL